MIGIFDSGSGGLAALRELRRLRPREGMIFLPDRDNAPYGTRTPEELCALAERGIDRLLRLGAENVLIACCTASTIYHSLPERTRAASLPIIEPTARMAKSMARGGRIGVIATDATVRSHAFAHALHGSEVLELPAQRLVGEIESGARDGAITPELMEYLDTLLLPAVRFGIDVLILGCTHFPLVEGEISRALGRISKKKILTVSSAMAGALAMHAALGDECDEGGVTVYL